MSNTHNKHILLEAQTGKSEYDSWNDPSYSNPINAESGDIMT